MSTEECIEELEVLSAIYGTDLERRKSAWNLPSFSIKLKPTALSDGLCFVNLQLMFILPKLYPRIPPKYEIEATEGLTEKNLIELREQLQDESILRSGQVMCHELATIAKEYLEIHNKRPQSLFESMTSRHQRENEVLRHLRAPRSGKREPPLRLLSFIDIPMMIENLCNFIFRRLPPFLSPKILNLIPLGYF